VCVEIIVVSVVITFVRDKITLRVEITLICVLTSHYAYIIIYNIIADIFFYSLITPINAPPPHGESLKLHFRENAGIASSLTNFYLRALYYLNFISFKIIFFIIYILRELMSYRSLYVPKLILFSSVQIIYFSTISLKLLQ
jgi:lipoprotein signal peptidase